MNKQIIGLFLLAATLFFVGCKSKKEVATPNGSVTLLSPKKAAKEIEKLAPPPNWVKISTSVEIIQDGERQTGSADIRMRQDSIFWVEIMDPIIGLKVARAFAMADTVAFLNRLERNYFAGSYTYVEKKLGTSLPFPYIFKLFQGQVFTSDFTVEIRDNLYQLADSKKQEISCTATLDPANFDCTQQTLVSPTDILVVKYSNYKMVNGHRFPFSIKVDVKGQKNLVANFEIKNIETSGSYKVPFNISSKYERID